MTGDERRAAARIACMLNRATRELVRAVQAADDGDDAALVFILRAELDVLGVAQQLKAVRRAVAIGVPVEARGWAVPAGRGGGATERDAAGRFVKVSRNGAP